MNIGDAFAAFKSDLELPDRKQKEVASAQQELRDRLAQLIGVEQSFLTGSYARHTKIFPLNDVDMFIVRNSQRTGLSYGGGTLPDQALNQIAAAVQRAYPLTARIEKQNRSVNVQLTGHDFGFDLTPAWLRYPDGYWIPDLETNSWVASDPEAHAARMTLENDLNSGKLKPLIKMVKHWSRKNLDLLRSFHIELICADIFRTEILDNFAVGMATVLTYLPHYLGVSMLDPIYGVSRVDKQLSKVDLEKLMLRTRSDAERAIDALRLQKVAGDESAIEKWQQVFISDFPIRGKTAVF